VTRATPARRTSSGWAPTSLPSNASTFGFVECEPGEHATGGGGSNRNALGVHLKLSAPRLGVGGPIGWQVWCENTTSETADGFAWAVCASP
jgi:hypothetical protein